jgi:hypothetical protein
VAGPPAGTAASLPKAAPPKPAPRRPGRLCRRPGECDDGEDHHAISRDVDDVLERTSPAAAEILTGLSPAQADELTRQVRDRLMAYASPDGVTMPGAAWLVTAEAV